EQQDPIREWTRVCNNITILVAWSFASSHQTTGPHTALANTRMCMQRRGSPISQPRNSALLRMAFTSIPCLNRTDFETLRASFVSFSIIARADTVQLARLPGFGPSVRAAGEAPEPP
ncbi:hypothetical protein EDB85DRAFT_1848182, partial [Lactarius pseudohatsudake]